MLSVHLLKNESRRFQSPEVWRAFIQARESLETIFLRRIDLHSRSDLLTILTIFYLIIYK